MKLLLLTYGSRGDVQPYVALGVRLMQAGHMVRLACPETFEDFVTSHGLEFVPLPGNPAQLAKELVDEAGSNLFQNMKIFMEFAIPLATDVVERCRAAAADVDGIVHGFPMTNLGEMLASEVEVPHMGALLLPIFTHTRAYSAPILPGGYPPLINLLTHKFFTQAFWQPSKFSYNRVVRPRAESLPKLGPWPFSPGKAYDVPLIYGFSPAVLPHPVDFPPNREIVGYWYLKEKDAYEPPQDLLEFLAAGPPPVYVGFGSVVTESREQVQTAVIEAFKRTGQRGILLGGWGGFSGGEFLPENVYPLESAPHDWLFPKMAAIVHHGGAGTTAASLRAGKPTIVVPFNSDQPFWGQRA